VPHSIEVPTDSLVVDPLHPARCLYDFPVYTPPLFTPTLNNKAKQKDLVGHGEA
jgi:hypothetical protein